jgi:ribosomal protein L11 methyltransferase
MSGERLTWRKLSAAITEDLWTERLSAFADRLAITALAGKPTVRVEVFALSRREADGLKGEFGGSVAKQPSLASLGETRRKPINIRGRLHVVASESEKEGFGRDGHALFIPTGMAFGTGEHATTLNCLRFLVDFAAVNEKRRWSILDLGCGSGILALGARMLGAGRVIAADFDPECVRVTRENCRANGLSGVTIRRVDVLTWEPRETFDLVCANLYSTILVQIAAKLADSVATGGTLIFSGVMRYQEKEVTKVFAKAGLRVTQVKRQGKWIAGTASRKL